MRDDRRDFFQAIGRPEASTGNIDLL